MRSESCELLVTTWDHGQVVAGTIVLASGQLRCAANKAYETLMANILKERTTNPREWLRSLPTKYAGSTLRARLLKNSGGNVKRRRTIVYWEFNIDILGPRYEKLADRRKARKVLSRRRLREIEKAALIATKAKLPAGFRAILS